VMILAREFPETRLLQQWSKDVPLLVVTNESGTGRCDKSVAPVTHMSMPGYGLGRTHKVKLALLLGLHEKIIDTEDTVVCLSGEMEQNGVNVLELIDVELEYQLLHSFRTDLQAGDVRPEVFHRVLHLASTLAGEGREGKPVGAIFIIGDYQNVRERCYQMVINPFRGYPESQRNILDPGLEETVKEFSRVDGACLIRGDGVVMSIGAYIQAEDAARALQSGLGARHAAGMAITMSTRAVSVVISESTRRISIFQNGELIVALDRSER